MFQMWTWLWGLEYQHRWGAQQLCVSTMSPHLLLSSLLLVLHPQAYGSLLWCPVPSYCQSTQELCYRKSQPVVIQVLTDVPKNTGLGSYMPLSTTFFSAHQYIILFLWEFLFEDISVCVSYSSTLNSQSGGSWGRGYLGSQQNLFWWSVKKATATLTSTFLKYTKSLLARIWFLVRLECSLRDTKLPSSSHVKSLLLGLVAHAVIPVLSRLKRENRVDGQFELHRAWRDGSSRGPGSNSWYLHSSS